MEFNKKNIFYATILHAACESGNIELVDYIRSLKIVPLREESVFFFEIIFKCNFKKKIFFIWFFFLENSWNSKIQLFYGTILHSACKSGNVKLVQYLVDLSAFLNINATTILTTLIFECNSKFIF